MCWSSRLFYAGDGIQQLMISQRTADGIIRGLAFADFLLETEAVRGAVRTVLANGIWATRLPRQGNKRSQVTKPCKCEMDV